MITINQHYAELPASYLFSEIARRVKAYQEQNPDADIIKMGIGDVTLPLPKACLDAMHKAVDELGHRETFRGYGPEQGYTFLQEKIAEFDFKPYGVEIGVDEIFVSDGAKSDTGNIGDILGIDNKIAVTDPVYPVYVDTNVMAGRAGELLESGCWSNIVYLPTKAENGFVPELPKEEVSVIYLCFPNNPTGTTLTKDQLKVWVDYAKQHKALILFDAAYEAFITEANVPHSIYEIEGAKEVAIEFRSYSKTAGFTGTRCSYTVVPKECMAFDKSGKAYSLNNFWRRRQCTKFNGTPYIVQRGAEAVYSPEGQKEVKEIIAYYQKNAKVIREGLSKKGFEVFGGINSPYVWFKTGEKDSWKFFDYLLKEKNIVTTPGVGFGPSGEGYIRMTAFNTNERTLEAIARI